MPEYFMIPQKPSEPGQALKLTTSIFTRAFFFQHAQAAGSQHGQQVGLLIAGCSSRAVVFCDLCVAPQRKGSNPSPLYSCTAAKDGDRCRAMWDHAVGCRKYINKEQQKDEQRYRKNAEHYIEI